MDDDSVRGHEKLCMFSKTSKPIPVPLELYGLGCCAREYLDIAAFKLVRGDYFDQSGGRVVTDRGLHVLSGPGCRACSVSLSDAVVLKLDCDRSVLVCCDCRFVLGGRHALGYWRREGWAALGRQLCPGHGCVSSPAEVGWVRRGGAQSDRVLDDGDVFLDVLCASGRVLDMLEDLCHRRLT